MKLIRRDYDVLTGRRDLEPLHRFTHFPVFMGCVEEEPANDVYADMNWQISRSSGLIQLDPVLPLDVIYQIGHGSGSTGLLWDRHHEAFARFVNMFSPRAVLEIGGCHGILAQKYLAMSPIDWTIVEPNPMPVAGLTARVIEGFFDESFRYETPFDAVIHSHVFEHIYEPDTFMQQLAGFMDDGKMLIFSVPNMEVMLQRKYTNCINFEHTVFLTEPYIEHLLARHGFLLLKKEFFLDDHSIFYAAVRDKTVPPQELPEGLFKRNRQLYLDYIAYHHDLIRRLNDLTHDTRKPVYLFGAHVFSQYLLAFGLNSDKIVCLLDNDANKQGKRLYGTSLFVQSPKVLRDVADPLVILKAGVYNEEVRLDILSNINGRAEFVE